MLTYWHCLVAGLTLGLFLNILSIRAVLLTFLTSFFLIILPLVLPSADQQEQMGESWYIVLIMFEVAFGMAALFIRAGVMSIVIAAFNGWNLLSHAFGLMAYHYDWPSYAWYGPLLRAGELAQVLTLILYAQPVVGMTLWALDRDRKDGNGQFRLDHGSYN